MCPSSRYAATPWHAGVRESSGYLSSGEGVVPVSQADMETFKKMFGEDMRCEKGCTGYAG
jgi:hypothetical protein